jgi:hypothetical protein
MGEFDGSRFFVPSPLIFRESAYERKDAWFMVFIVKPCLVPSLERSLHRKVKESTRTYSNNLSVGGAWLVFQKEVIFKQRKIRRNPKEVLTKMHKDNNLEDRIGIQMN